MRLGWLWILAIGWGCDDGAAGDPPDGGVGDAAADTAVGDVAVGDVAVGDMTVGDMTLGDMAASDLGAADALVDASPTAPPLATQRIAEPPADPLAGGAVESCATIDDTRCVDGGQQVCAIYDTAAGAFSAAPDPLLVRALRFDRWYARYHAPDGQTAERRFMAATPPGTPEAEWGAPERFLGYAGYGDSAIWTGVALHATALRYLETGTEADYQRMVAKARALLLDFDVTGVPGYLARAHFGLAAEGAPRTADHIVRYGDAVLDDHRNVPFDAATVPDAPAFYTEGYPGPDGPVPVQPVWHGNPSIDQYTGAMVAAPLVAGLLRPEDAAVGERFVTHLTCYLKRLERIELVNIQQNPQILDLLQELLGGGRLVLDPGDPDFGAIDRLVVYALRQYNGRNADTYPRACPDAVRRPAWRTIDLSSPGYLGQILVLAQDLQSRDNHRVEGIDHVYVPGLRAGDALHLMHLAAIGWHFTGEDPYRQLFFEELVGEAATLEVIQTAAALRQPDWCRAFFGGHITYPAFFALHRLLADPELRAPIARAMFEEFWQKSRGGLADLKFDLMFAAMADAWPEARAEARARVEPALTSLGGNGGILDDPRRAYSVAPDAVVAALGGPEEALRCPSLEERSHCEAPIAFMGIEFPGEAITGQCRDDALDCPFEDGVCARALTTAPIPLPLRRFTDFLWQRNPFEPGYSVGVEGLIQSPGLDVIEAFWLARHTGAIDAGRDQVLAWREDGACAP